METHYKGSRLCHLTCLFCSTRPEASRPLGSSIQLRCNYCNCILLSDGYFIKDSKVNDKSCFCMICFNKYVITVPLSLLMVNGEH